MNIKLIATIMLVVAASMGLQAQTVFENPAQAHQQQASEVDRRIAGYKTELIKLQSELTIAERKASEAARIAKASAEANREGAEKLAANPRDKSLSADANKLAKSARQDAKSARKAAANQSEIEGEIARVQKKLHEKEAEIVSRPSVATAPVQATPSDAPAPKAREAMPVVSYPANRIVVADTQEQEDSRRHITDKVIEQTYKNYPQQAGQPTIIINNIVVPPDYSPRATPSPQAMSKPVPSGQEMQDIEALKLRLRQVESMLAANQASQNSPVANTASEPAATQQKLTFAQRFGEVKSRRSGLWVIPMAGIHASNFEADFSDDEAKGRSGWNAGLDFRAHQKRFFIQPGVHYFSSSMDVTSKDSLSNAPLLKGPRIHSLKVPLLIGVYLTREQGAFLKLNLKGGITGTYILAVDKNGMTRFTKDNIEEFSYGLNAGLGIELGLLTIDLSHEWGMSPLFKDDKSKSNVLRATIGIKI